MDLYLFNTIVNSVWYLFTILFVLYRFTSFFSYAYNFVLFCRDLYQYTRQGFTYIYNYIRSQSGYTRIGTDETEHLLPTGSGERQGSFLRRIGNNITYGYHKCYYWLIGRHHPLSEEATASTLSESIESSIRDRSFDHLDYLRQSNQVNRNLGSYRDRNFYDFYRQHNTNSYHGPEDNGRNSVANTFVSVDLHTKDAYYDPRMESSIFNPTPEKSENKPDNISEIKRMHNLRDSEDIFKSSVMNRIFSSKGNPEQKTSLLSVNLNKDNSNQEVSSQIEVDSSSDFTESELVSFFKNELKNPADQQQDNINILESRNSKFLSDPNESTLWQSS